jgi:hypothetical protein
MEKVSMQKRRLTHSQKITILDAILKNTEKLERKLDGFLNGKE